MTQPITGRCLCGAIQYSSGAEPMMMGHCHCEDCRRSSGSGHTSHLALPETSVTITGAPKASLDDLEVFKPQMHVYASRAASWDKPGPDLTAFDIMPSGM